MRTFILLFLSATGCSDYEFAPNELASEGETGTPEVIDTGTPADNTWVDSWDLAEVAGVDVLFFGDTSGSMAVELKTLGSQVTAFVDRLATYTDRWQLLAVTGPEGCGVNGVLSPETPDYATLFAAGITTPPGEDKVDEWGLHNASQAVAQATTGACNEGFLRPEARLHVIFISDEDDNSPGFDSGDADYWQAYTDAIVAARGDANQVVFSGVIGPTPKGCSGAEPGTGYAEAIEAYGGELLSICEAWYDQLDVLVDASVAWPIFHLTEIPVEGSVTVFVNGLQRTSGWTYSSIDNIVMFTENVPTIGDEVSVSYERADAE